ncbi:ATP-binding cassette domain-containing protein [Methanobrevibacter sp.]
MSLMERIKNIFKGNNNSQVESTKKILPPAKWKYENMVLFVANKTMKEGEKAFFYAEVYDKNSDPIANENIEITIDDETFTEKTNENGIVSIPLEEFEKGTYTVLTKYPNGDYSQAVETELKIKRPSKKVKPKKTAPPSPKKVSLVIPKMRMYINNEGQYFARLRDLKFNPIEGEELKFTIEDKVYTATTDHNGFARIDIADLGSGMHEVIVEHMESSKYEYISRKSELQMHIRDIDKEIMIEVDHLSMEFKVTKDKIDTLKEFIIRTLKRNKEKQSTIKIIDDISFKVYKGDRVGLLGFNGAGKSTLLKIMSGIYEPTSGTIKTYGKIAPLLELGAGFDKNYSGKNNIYLNGSLLSIDEKIINEKYDEIVEFSELGEFINYPIKNYSSGMRAKLGFSIATQINPDILIIDEILSVGDIKFKRKSAEKINSMMKEGVTVLLVSHSIRQIQKICDTCIWLEDGKIKMEGDSKEVCEAYIKGARQDIKKEKKKK